VSEKVGLFHGIVRSGVVVFDPKVQLPEGTHVEVAVLPLDFTPEERAEFEAWDRLSDEAWAMIDQWEKEDKDAAG
jgi:hypothetical protein